MVCLTINNWQRHLIRNITLYCRYGCLKYPIYAHRVFAQKV